MFLRNALSTSLAFKLPLQRIVGTRMISSLPKSDQQPDGQQEELLYEMSQGKTIKAMLGAGCFNFVYWSYYITHSLYYADEVVQGIKLAGDPTWGYFGAFATGLIFFATKEFAHYSVYRCYVSADKQRIGFQMHNIIGKSGRKVEVKIGNAQYYSQKTSWSSSLLPIRVEGLKRNALIDIDGKYLDKARLTSLLTTVSSKGADSKDDRLQRIEATKRKQRR